MCAHAFLCKFVQVVQVVQRFSSFLFVSPLVVASLGQYKEVGRQPAFERPLTHTHGHRNLHALAGGECYRYPLVDSLLQYAQFDAKGSFRFASFFAYRPILGYIWLPTFLQLVLSLCCLIPRGVPLGVGCRVGIPFCV